MSTQRTIGLIGGVTWLSTADYYRAINEEVRQRLGGVHSARLVLVSLDFHDVRSLATANDESGLLALYASAASSLERAGASAFILCTNTAHRRAEGLQQRVGIPLLHIADPVGRAAQLSGARTLGLLGTRPTMEEPFLRGRLGHHFGLSILTPPAPDRQRLEHVIFQEMARGQFLPATASFVIGLCGDLVAKGAQAVVLGCTELPILLRDVALPCPVLDTTQLHAIAAADFCLGASD